jgi:hypothetical protein
MTNDNCFYNEYGLKAESIQPLADALTLMVSQDPAEQWREPGDNGFDSVVLTFENLEAIYRAACIERQALAWTGQTLTRTRTPQPTQTLPGNATASPCPTDPTAVDQ